MGNLMETKTAFDNEKYLAEQAEEIKKRIDRFDNKLYLEFGGKLLFDFHASRVLPGFDPNVKMRLLQGLADKAEVILCIFAGDIEKKKMRADFGITYDADALKLIDDLRGWGISVLGVVITRFDDQPAALVFNPLVFLGLSAIAVWSTADVIRLSAGRRPWQKASMCRWSMCRCRS